MTAPFVLVHGGAHGGWCYQRVADMLRAAGYEVYAPTMTGVGERSHLVGPGVDLDMHVRDITAVLHYEDLRNTILVGHSYGGMVITGVGDRAPDRIGKLVFLDAATPVNGQSLVDGAGPVIEAVRRSVVSSMVSSSSCFPVPTTGGSTASPIPTTWRGWPSA